MKNIKYSFQWKGLGWIAIIVIDEIKLKQDNAKVIKLVRGDITERNTDAMVNAANSYLKHGGGVAAAIVRKGGSTIQDESDKIGFVPVGSAVITTAGKLSSKAVIHVVGPRTGEGNEDEKLTNAVKNALLLASKQNFSSVSMPAISSGIFGFPKDKCAKILVEESKRFLENETTSIEVIEFCIIDDETIEYFKAQFSDRKNQ